MATFFPKKKKYTEAVKLWKPTKDV